LLDFFLDPFLDLEDLLVGFFLDVDFLVVCPFLATVLPFAPMASVWLNSPKARIRYKMYCFKEDKFTKSKCKKRYKITYYINM
jgi:hypothetical protein